MFQAFYKVLVSMNLDSHVLETLRISFDKISRAYTDGVIRCGLFSSGRRSSQLIIFEKLFNLLDDMFNTVLKMLLKNLKKKNEFKKYSYAYIQVKRIRYIMLKLLTNYRLRIFY